MLPDELEWVLEMLGFHWPTADEDQLVRCAEVWERFAEDATRLHADADRSTSTVVSHNAGESIDAFQAAYDRFQGDDGHLHNAAQAATVIGTALRAAAVVVETGKIAVIAQLVALAVELISAQAAAPFTLGVSELGSTGATAATRLIVRRLLHEVRQALLEAIVDCMKEPAVSAIEAMVTDLVRQTVNVDFGAQKGYDLGATAQAGARGAWTATQQTPRTFLESLRDSMGRQAGGTARSRLDGYLDAGSPFRDGATSSVPGTGEDGGGPLDPGTKDDFVSLSADGSGPGFGPDLDATGSPDGEGDGLPSPGGDTGPGPVFDSDGGSGYPPPAPRSDGPSLPDFDSPSPAAPGGAGPAHGGLPSPDRHSVPAHSSPPPSAPDHRGGSIRTEIDGLAAHSPAHTAPAHTPHMPEPSPTPTPPRGDTGGPAATPAQGPAGHPGAGTHPGPHPSGPAPSPGRAGGPAGPNPASPVTGPGSAPRTSPPAATQSPAQPSAPVGDGRPSSTPQQRPPVVPGSGTPQPHGAPSRTPGAPGQAPEQPGGSTRSDPGAHEPGARQTAQPSPSSTSRGHTVVPVPAVLIPRPGRPAGGHPAGIGGPWSTAGGADRFPGDGRPAPRGLHEIRGDLDHEPGGLGAVDPGDQQTLESAVPRNPDGVPERFPDPFGEWSLLQNGSGNETPGRSNNSADCSRSFLETWYGNPQVSAPRTLDLDEHGRPDPWTSEDDANENQVRWAGAPHTYAGTGDDPDTAGRIEQDLLRSGHGAAALVQVDWPGGGGHAFNAVNHGGSVVWVDAQSADVGHEPLHIADAEHVWHLPMDPEGRPLYAARPDAVADEPDPVRTDVQGETA